MTASILDRLTRAGIALLGLMALATGTWALASWQHFHDALAAHTGPANHHYIRDVGAAYATAGVALLVAVFVRRWRTALTGAAALFLTLHAGVHVFETAAGEVGVEHLIADLPGVVAPALLSCLLFVVSLRSDAPGYGRGAGLEAGEAS